MEKCLHRIYIYGGCLTVLENPTSDFELKNNLRKSDINFLLKTNIFRVGFQKKLSDQSRLMGMGK